MLVDLRINQLLEVRFEAFVGAFLVGSHQTRIARHVSSKDRSETAGRSHSHVFPKELREHSILEGRSGKSSKTGNRTIAGR